MGIFIDPDNLPEDAGGFAQLMFLTAVYGYILFRYGVYAGLCVGRLDMYRIC